MTFFTRTLLCGLGVFSLGVLDSPAFIGGLFKKDDEVLNSQQLNTQEGSAAAQLGKAQGQESAGRRGQAKDTYRSITRSYPRTEAAMIAQFRYAKILEGENEGRKAFEAYDELLTQYRNTPNFNEAIQSQYTIAEGLGKSDRKGFLGIGAAIQPSKLVEMYEKIAEAAPQSEFAPKSLLSIGYVHSKGGATAEALASFQSVVDSYPGTQYATEAQYQIFKLRGVTAENSNSPNEDRAQVEAGLDFVNQNPEDARSQEIQSSLQQIEEREMQKQFETGMFYEKSNKPESARLYYSRVAANPNTAWAAKARERLANLDRAPTVDKRAGLFGPKPEKEETVEMRTSTDEVVPLPAPNS